uniref:ATP synthase complex subunit 8 n=1 Tax=Mileewa alara TaxID=2545672 RepID=A0A899IKK4_9HEMI|nr:ATP synthase F0 subunit 8 [Mileewa alara]
MPQMSPIWWTSLMIYFIIMLMLINSMIYFNLIKIKLKKKMITTKKNNWKW